jgi:hypothetical protein
MGAASVLITSGCATAFVRSESTVDPKHVFPATAFDAQFFWEAGVKGEPLIAMVDPWLPLGATDAKQLRTSWSMEQTRLCRTLCVRGAY